MVWANKLIIFRNRFICKFLTIIESACSDYLSCNIERKNSEPEEKEDEMRISQLKLKLTERLNSITNS